MLAILQRIQRKLHLYNEGNARNKKQARMEVQRKRERELSLARVAKREDHGVRPLEVVEETQRDEEPASMPEWMRTERVIFSGEHDRAETSNLESILGRDCLSVVLDFMEPKELALLSYVNRNFYSLVNANYRWKLLTLTTFPQFPEEELKNASGLEWKKMFRRFYEMQFVEWAKDQLSVYNDQFSVKKLPTSCWSSAVARVSFGLGLHYWEVRIDEDTQRKAIMIGVTNNPTSYSKGIYQTRHGWAYYSYTGEGYHEYRSKQYADNYGAGDVIGVLVDVSPTGSSVGFYKNGEYKGKAYDIQGERFWPFVDLWAGEKNAVTVLPFRSSPPDGRTANELLDAPPP